MSKISYFYLCIGINAKTSFNRIVVMHSGRKVISPVIMELNLYNSIYLKNKNNTIIYIIQLKFILYYILVYELLLLLLW